MSSHCRPELLGLALLAVSVPALARAPVAPPALPPPVASVEGLSEYRLANGLRVLLFPDPGKATVTSAIVYFVGSKREGTGETGMAHLLEHMMFRGTPITPRVFQAISQRGGTTNGGTYFDSTFYYEVLPASDENLRWALSFEADRMVHSVISPKDLDAEMTVVRNEMEQGETLPSRILHERVLSTAYLWHNYGKATIGSRSDVEHVPADRLQAFYKRYYRPDNALLLLAGRFDPAQALAEVKKAFGPLQASPEPLPGAYTVEPTQDGERHVTLRRSGGDVSLLMTAYHVPSSAHPDFAPLEVLGEVLGSSTSGRLYRALVEAKKAAQVSYRAEHLQDPSVLTFDAVVRQGQSLDAAREALLSTVEEASHAPFTVQEVERARKALLKDTELVLEDDPRFGSIMKLIEWTGVGDWRLFFLHRDRLEAVTAADVTRVAAHYLKSSNRTLGEFLPTATPDRAEVPASADVAAMLQGYQGRAAVARGEAFDPSPENIEKRVVRSQVGGLKLALLPKKTLGERVNVSLALHWGSLPALMGREEDARVAAEMLMRGTTKHSRQELSDALDQLKAEVSVSSLPTGVSLSVEVPRPGLSATMALVAELLREPAFTEQEFTLFRQEELAFLERQRGEPPAEAWDALSLAMSPYPVGHPYRERTIKESLVGLEGVTVARVRAFHREFYGASQGELAAVGDFDAQALPRQVAELFADWKSPAPYARVPERPVQSQGSAQVVETPDKANAMFYASQGLGLRDDHPDYPALMLGNYLLGGSSGSRLMKRVREKEGLSYGVRSQLTVQALDPVGRFIVSAIHAPQNTERLEQTLREELEKVLREGFDAEEFNQARTGLLEARRSRRANDKALASKLGDSLLFQRTLDYDAALEKRMRELTPEDVRAALTRAFDWKRLTVVRAGDFASVKAKAAVPAPGP